MDTTQPSESAYVVGCNDAALMHDLESRGDATAGPHDALPDTFRVYQTGNYNGAQRKFLSGRRHREERQRSRNTLEAVHYQSPDEVPLGVPQRVDSLPYETAAAHPRAHGSGRGSGRSSYGGRVQHQGGHLGSGQSRRRQPAAGNITDTYGATTGQTLNTRTSPGTLQDSSPSQRTSSGQMHDALSCECVAVRSECNRAPHGESGADAGMAVKASTNPGDGMDVNSQALSTILGGRSRCQGRGSRGRGRSEPSTSTRQRSGASAGPQVDIARHRGRRGVNSRDGGRGRASPVDGRGNECTPGVSQAVVTALTYPDTTCGVDYSGASVKKPSAAVAEAANGARGSDDDEETLTCVICCEAAPAVVIGSCGHSHTCAKCCLRLRLCYRDLRCPLCKAVNKEVVVVRPSLALGSSFESLAGLPQQREALWQQPRWAKGVLIYDPLLQACEHLLNALQPQPQQKLRQGMSRRRPLHKTLQAMTSRSCSVCDHNGHHPFGTMNLLQEHLRSAHSKMLCDVCVGAGLKFPLEYPTYDAESLVAHMAERHPRCEYCDLAFYGPDELYGHMTQRHYTCHVCSRLGRHHLYFQDADTLQVHFREEHHVCDHPDCFGCMIAFNTREELAGHIRDRHSSHMPRWDHSRARPLLLDFVPSRGPAATTAAAGSAASGRPGPRNDRRGRGPGLDHRQHPDRTGPSALEDPSAFPSLQSQRAAAHLPPPPQQQHARLADVRDTEGGLIVIDDDLGMGSGQGRVAMGGMPGAGSSTASAVQERRPVVPADTAGSHSLGPNFRLAGAWAGRQPGSGTFREDFPELSTAASSTGAALRTAWGPGGSITEEPGRAPISPQQHRTTAASLLSLRKVTVHCPCGNRVEHLALRSVEELACDRDCATKQRRAQLADAFGVNIVEGHVPYFDRHRTPHFTAAQILAAQAAGIDWVASIERELAGFVADPSVRRTSLVVGMSQAQRKLVHELAEHYGLSSHSVGQGASRAVQLLKGATSGVPTRLLSVVAAATAPEEIARLAAGSEGASGPGWVIKLVDVAPGVDVRKHLWTWEGDYTLTPVPGSSSSLRLIFNRESSFRDCCARLGGGIRGVFRTVVVRDQDPRRAAAAMVGVPTGSPGSAKPVAPAAVPPGWQVLRGKVAAPGGHKDGAPSGSEGADPALAVRSALAADAWSSDEDGTFQAQSQHRRAKEGITDGSGKRWSASTVPPSAVVSQLHPPRCGPSLELELATPWLALMSGGGDGGGEDDGEGTGGADWEAANAMQATVNTAEVKEMERNWDDIEVQTNQAQ
ncbi:hypothetical protein Vretifemale_18218 [Volvox reticuliferus]|uniref:RING-type E3 ubiquitin transferase n=1 Tax=Volvox reticuliferus TaxID=1737510 RepID=A0A8J4D2L6_9CHLO|nr:hypothetical protein Vretifemale_18218 [Volvox reticuliferus]